jgi:hypothetical protein
MDEVLEQNERFVLTARTKVTDRMLILNQRIKRRPVLGGLINEYERAA